MKCIGTYQNHRLYYDTKHDEYLLMTPNFRFCRMFGHCNNEEVAEWAYKLKNALDTPHSQSKGIPVSMTTASVVAGLTQSPQA